MGNPRERRYRAENQNNQPQDATNESKLGASSRRDLFRAVFKKRKELIKPTEPVPEDICNLNLNRRETLKAGAMGAVLLVPVLRGNASEAKASSRSKNSEPSIPLLSPTDNKNDQNPPDDGNKNSDPHSEIENKGHHESTKLNDWTARGVVGSFFGIVAGVTAGKIQLGPKTSLTMTALEAGRLAALKTSGNPSDQEAFKHDKAELTGAYPLVPVLVEMAHIASNIRVDSDKIFHEAGGTDAIKNESVAMPSEQHSSIEEWEEYYEHTASKVADQLGQQQALGADAPKLSTYVSSSTTNSRHEAVLESVYSMKYAENVINTRKQLEKEKSTQVKLPNIVDLKRKSLRQAQKVVNGPGGVMDLILAGPCNGFGNAFIGDPPNIYAFFKKREYFLQYSLMGLAINEFNGVVSSSMFLKRAGVKGNIGRFNKSFLQGQLKIYEAQWETLKKDKRLRDVSLGGKKEAQAVFEDIQNGAHDQLHERLSTIPQPYFHADIRSVLGHQGDMIKAKIDRIRKRINTDELTETRFDHDRYEELLLHNNSLHERRDALDALQELEHDSITKKALFDALKKGDGKTIANYINEMLEARRTVQQADMAALFEEIVGNNFSEADLENINAMIQQFSEGGKSDDDKEADDKLKAAQDKLKEAQSKKALIEKLESMAQNQLSEKRPENEELKEHFENDDQVKLWEALSIIDKKDVRKSIMLYLSQPGQHDEPADGHGHTKKTLLSHQAAEVAAALTTQIPAVPSLVHFVQRDVLPFFTKGITDPDERLKRGRDVIVVMSEIISGFADNVAAYLFALTSLEELYKERFGEDVLDKNKSLDKAISLTALFAAVYAGGLTLFGNGPNFLQEEPVGEIDDDGVLHVHREKRTLASTMHNPYALAGSAAVFFIGRHFIDKAADKIDKPVTT